MSVRDDNECHEESVRNASAVCHYFFVSVNVLFSVFQDLLDTDDTMNTKRRP
jgi:hypothetical protein